VQPGVTGYGTDKGSYCILARVKRTNPINGTRNVNYNKIVKEERKYHIIHMMVKKKKKRKHLPVAQVAQQPLKTLPSCSTPLAQVALFFLPD
jgi:hypothetical protein